MCLDYENDDLPNVITLINLKIKEHFGINFLQVVESLLAKSDPNEPVLDEVKLTPLHLAIISNRVETLKVTYTLCPR
jgi:hypothetical protein